MPGYKVLITTSANLVLDPHCRLSNYFAPLDCIPMIPWCKCVVWGATAITGVPFSISAIGPWQLPRDKQDMANMKPPSFNAPSSTSGTEFYTDGFIGG